MHRFLGPFVLGASVFIIAGTSYAQSPATSSGRPFKLGGTFGATLPVGDFGDAADVGFHFGGLIDYKPNAIPFNLRGEITYHRLGLPEGAFGTGFEDVDGNWGVLSFLGNAVFPFGDPASTARPYGLGGVGVYRMKQSGERGNVDLSRTQTKFGINLGGGFQFNLSGFETFVEARFHSVFTEGKNANFIPLSFGFKF